MTTEAKLNNYLDEAERKAWDSLSRYKFQMFGYWASIWIHLNQISGAKRPNPFRELVLTARARNGYKPHKTIDNYIKGEIPK